jgi:hypothetical protein
MGFRARLERLGAAPQAGEDGYRHHRWQSHIKERSLSVVHR